MIKTIKDDLKFYASSIVRGLRYIRFATKLKTARSINGTNFDGTGNITTTSWGTSRTITIGETSKSVNGGSNVSWSLSEIGASEIGHTHSYAGSTSVGGSANSAVKLTTDTAGSAKKPVYFSDGKPVACTYSLGNRFEE